jgi:hypothetical protein
MKKIHSLLLILFISINAIFFQAFAGSVEGPHLVWVNLTSSAKELNSVDSRLKNFLNNQDKFCWDDGLLVFMKNKPRQMTHKLVMSAVVKRQGASIKKINEILKTPFDEAVSGFDGIVVYTDKPKPMLYSITTGKMKIISDSVDRPEHLEGAFCNVIPPIVRKP